MNVVIGGTSHPAVHGALRQLVTGAERVSIAVSYLQVSGWDLLRAMLTPAQRKGLRVVCTDQMGITDPVAVRNMLSAGIPVHAYLPTSHVFHPKVYLAHQTGSATRFLLGSANLSRSALETAVELEVGGEDSGGELEAWFDTLFSDPERSEMFSAGRLAQLEARFAARIQGRLAMTRAKPRTSSGLITDGDLDAEETIEAAFGALPNIVVPLNVDKAGNNVRTLRRIHQILNDPTQLEGKALNELRVRTH